MGLLRRLRARRPATPEASRCSCGAPLDPVDLNYGFALPDEVFALGPDEQLTRVGGLSRVLVLDEDRGFVRTLLPIELDHDSLTLVVWLEVEARRACEAIAVWESPAYLDLSFDGVVANDLESWGSALHGAHGHARPRSQDELPRVADGDTVVRGYLTGTCRARSCWPVFPSSVTPTSSCTRSAGRARGPEPEERPEVEARRGASHRSDADVAAGPTKRPTDVLLRPGRRSTHEKRPVSSPRASPWRRAGRQSHRSGTARPGPARRR